MNTLTRELELEEGRNIFLLSDLHSNLPALDAVLAEIPKNAQILCAGDLLGYYLEPNEICERLRQRGAISIKGNHDKYVLGELAYPPSREEKYRIVETRHALSDENFAWVKSLPDTLSLKIRLGTQGCKDSRQLGICLAHGSPRDVEEYVYPDTPIDFLERTEPGFLILGHTHHPMIRQAGALTVINPGSVGQVRDRIPGASYASLNPFSGSIVQHRAPYDVGAYQRLLERAGVQTSMIEILSRSNK